MAMQIFGSKSETSSSLTKSAGVSLHSEIRFSYFVADIKISVFFD
jgi:hypothetical protein